MKKMLAGGIALIVVLCGFNIFAYSTGFTHPHLARETGKFYSYFFPENKLLIEEMEWLARGARDEDTPPRYVNHFYNPLTNEPWLGAGNAVALTAKDWANNRDAQKMDGGDWTFEEAIYQYRAGNKREAFIALGHVLHLVEDMSVPEHTRNDTHVPNPGTESPYEEWAEEYNQYNKDEISKELISGGKKLSSCFSLENCFNEVAYYSNGYFFSIDSVEKFENPKIIRWGEEKSSTNDFISYGYGIDENGDEFKLISRGAPQWRNFSEVNDYELDANILSDYYSRLSRKSVVVGAKVIQLFFDEIKRLNVENIPNVRPLSFWDRFSSKIRSAFWFLPPRPKKTIAMNVENSEPTEEKNEAEPVVNDVEELVVEIVELPEPLKKITKSEEPKERKEDDVIEQAMIEENNPTSEILFIPEGSAEEDAITEVPLLTPLQRAIALYGEGFGGFYAPANPSPKDEDVEIVEETPIENDYSEGTEEIIETEPVQSATTTEDIILPDDFTEENSTSTETLPEENLSILDEEFILDENEDEVDEESVEATSTKITGIHIVISEIKISGEKKNDEFVELYNPTDSDVLLSEWKLRPFSKNGNEKSYLLRPFPESAIIQSNGYYLIAHEEYAGEIIADALYSTKESLADDNGLILYNAEGSIVDIVGWGDLNSVDIYETSPVQAIPDSLSLERKASASSTMESMVLGGLDEFLGNGYDSDDNLNDFILREIPNPQNGASDKESQNTIIEIDDDAEDLEEYSESEEEILLGPTVLYGEISNIAMTLYPKFNPYIVSADFSVKDTAKLIIEPGVVIKFGKEFQSTWMKFPSSIHISGSLEINGTEENPVIFTSILDDNYAGDTNGDGSETGPAMDNWGAIIIESEADQTIDISHAKFFYGGASQGTATNGAVLVSRGGAVVNISDCYFANNRTAISNFGWKNTLSRPINITRTLIENNKSGIILDVFAPVAIQRSTIRNNQQYGIYLEAYAPEVFFMEESNIYGNGQYGLWNFYGSRLKENGLKLSDITAQNNWWGDAGGPLPSWKANKVKDKVDFSNWLTEEYIL